jgi:hypothetical protein
MFEFLKQAAKAPWGVFFYLGVTFVVAAVTGGFAIKSDYTSVNQVFIIPLFVLGATLIIYTMYREWQDNRPKPDPKAPVDPSAYRLDVTKKPPATNKVTLPLIFEGRIRRDPKLDGLQLWFVHGAGPKYWPGNPIVVQPNKQWSLQHTPPESKAGEVQYFSFCLVGKNGQALIKAFKTINAAQIAKPGDPYEALTELTDDFIPLFEHSVALISDRDEPDLIRPG